MLCLSSTSDETGCGMLMPDGTSTVCVASEPRVDLKCPGVKMSPVMYHYESMESEGTSFGAKNHSTLTKKCGDESTPSCKTAFGGVDCSHGTEAVKPVGSFNEAAKCVNATPKESE